jgi:hypothetical protein
MADVPLTESSEVTIADAAGTNKLVVNLDGSINAVITVGGTVKTSQVTYNPPTVGDQAGAVVAAVVGKKIRVYSIAVSLGINSSNVYLRNGAGGTQLSVLYLRTTGGSVPSFYYQEATFGTFLFETGVNTALVCNSSTNTGPVSIQIVYTEV